MEAKQSIAILILGAGNSSRMEERVKQVLPWKNTTLLGNAVNQATATMANKTYVVLGAFEEVIKAEVQLDAVVTIQNANWQSGLGSSIASGIAHFSAKSLLYDAVLIMLADQPLIDSNYLNKMIGNWIGNPSKIITTQYESGSGVPAIFGNEHFRELGILNKDFGAKDIIATHKDAILALNPEGKEIDVDSWETYQDLIKQLQS